MTKPSLVLHLSTPGGFRTFAEMNEAEQRFVERIHALREISSSISDGPPCGALLFRRHDRSRFMSVSSLGEHAAVTILKTARMFDVTTDIILAFSVEDNRSLDSVPDEVLEALSDFGPTTLYLVGDDRSIAIATTGEVPAA